MRSFFTFIFIFLICGIVFSQNFYDINSVKDLRLYFEDKDWKQDLIILKERNQEQRLIGKLSINGVNYDSVGVRFKGNSSYFSIKKNDEDKFPLNIKLNYIIKNQKLSEGNTTIKLSNIFRDPSYVREALSYEIVGHYMVAPRANYARVFVNDTLIGLYTNTESIDEDFIQKRFNLDSISYFKADPIWGAKKSDKCKNVEKPSLFYAGDDFHCYENFYEKSDDAQWNHLIQLTKTISSNNPLQIEEILNVDQVLWMLALNNTLVNLDSYSGMLGHNYYIVRSKKNYFTPVMWDLNLSFGGFRYSDDGKPTLKNEELQNLSPIDNLEGKERPLINILLNNPLYRKIYVHHIKTILKNEIANESYYQRAKYMQSLIEYYVKSDSSRLYEYDLFHQNLDQTCTIEKTDIIGIKELMSKRLDYYNNHPLFTSEVPVFNKKDVIINDSTVLFSLDAEKANHVYLFYREHYESPYRRLELVKNATSEHLYEGIVAKDKILEYYFVVEADKSAICVPEKGSAEPTKF
ncbi:MAG: CotH kinase family protein [Saprospiraceae bacterium]|nr:CotH kinase family protein [Saprospiraceae bacterium]